MKVLKKLSALIAAVAIFGSTAMAADVAFDSKLEASADTEQVIVNIYAGDAVTSIGQFASFFVVYDTEIYTLNTTDSVMKYGDELKDNGASGASWATTVDVTITDKLICSLAFDVIDGKSPIGTTFTVNDGGGCMWDTGMNTFYSDFGGSITVTAATPAGPSVTKGTAAGTVTEYTFANSDSMSGKKVLMTTDATAGNTITEDTRFYASYRGAEPRVFGSDIWDKLAQGGGSITVNNVKFGIIVSEGMNASNFTFEVK